MKNQKQLRQPVAEAQGTGRETLILGVPWSSSDGVAICHELTGVVVRVCRFESGRPPEGAQRHGSALEKGGSPFSASEPCLTLALEGAQSASRLHGIPYRYRCPHGVPCACISVAPASSRCRAHILARACSDLSGSRPPCLARLPSGVPVSALRLADDEFDLAVDLLSVMAGSVQSAAEPLQPLRQTGKRLTGQQKRLIHHVCRAVHTRSGDANLRLGLFAAENAVSSAYLCTLFTRALGVPFRSYLQAWRMFKVREWLSEGRLSIKEIASRAGYNDPNRLRLAFKATTGLAPRDWRERQLSEIAFVPV